MKFPNVVLAGRRADALRRRRHRARSFGCDVGRSEWIREAWDGTIVVKGVHIGDDARRAIDAGADAIVVSNHGGRQLDDVHPTIRALPEVVAAARGQIEVLVDGGIRRGSDVAKALCLGARAVLVGRAYAYGLGAAGGAGVPARWRSCAPTCCARSSCSDVHQPRRSIVVRRAAAGMVALTVMIALAISVSDSTRRGRAHQERARRSSRRSPAAAPLCTARCPGSSSPTLAARA